MYAQPPHSKEDLPAPNLLENTITTVKCDLYRHEAAAMPARGGEKRDDKTTTKVLKREGQRNENLSYKLLLSVRNLFDFKHRFTSSTITIHQLSGLIAIGGRASKLSKRSRSHELHSYKYAYSELVYESRKRLRCTEHVYKHKKLMQ